MGNILNLIKLDKAIMKPYYKYFLVIIIAPILVMLSYKNIVYGIIFAMTMAAMTSSYTFSVTEKNDLNRLYGLLPVNKKEIVSGRYIFTTLLGLVLLVISLALMLVIFVFFKIPFTIDEVITGISSGILIYSFFTAIQLPGYFKLGAIKGRAFNFLPFIGIFLIGSIADSIGLSSYTNTSLPAILNNPFGMLAMAILLAVVLYCISIGITQRIYDKMEL